MKWAVRLSAAAERDFANIIDWTIERFGKRQAEIYAEVLIAATQTLHSGPAVTGVKARSEIGKGIFTLHAARGSTKARHFLMFRVSLDDDATIDVIRILHDAMDLPRHLPPED
jgi:toxin ParE1/3/4